MGFKQRKGCHLPLKGSVHHVTSIGVTALNQARMLAAVAFNIIFPCPFYLKKNCFSFFFFLLFPYYSRPHPKSTISSFHSSITISEVVEKPAKPKVQQVPAEDDGEQSYC